MQSKALNCQKSSSMHQSILPFTTLPPSFLPQLHLTIRTIPFRPPSRWLLQSHTLEVEPFTLALHTVHPKRAHISTKLQNHCIQSRKFRTEKSKQDGSILTSVFSQQTIVPKLTSPHRQYLGSSGSISSPTASSSSLVSSSSSLTSLAVALPSAAVATFLAAFAAAAVPFFLGAFFLLPTLTAAPPSCELVTGPGAGRLLRRLAAVVRGVGAGVALLRRR